MKATIVVPVVLLILSVGSYVMASDRLAEIELRATSNCTINPSPFFDNTPAFCTCFMGRVLKGRTVDMWLDVVTFGSRPFEMPDLTVGEILSMAAAC